MDKYSVKKYYATGISAAGSAKTIRNTETIAYLIIVAGQSNADGQGLTQRLSNTQFNYKGIAAGYPNPRTTQGQYVLNPSGVYIYSKGKNPAYSIQITDNGHWVGYVAPTYSSSSDTGFYAHFGPELPLSQYLRDVTGKEIFILKPAFSGTPLSPGVPSSFGPGNWTDDTLGDRYSDITKKVLPIWWYQNALRDFHSFRPGVTLIPLVVLWHQGESDEGAATTQQYADALTDFIDKNTRMITTYFSTYRHPVPTAVIKLDMHRDADEATIVAAQQMVAGVMKNTVLIENSRYPRRSDLTTAECAPVAFDSISGDPDSGSHGLHASYIKILSIGELVGQWLAGNGYLT